MKLHLPVRLFKSILSCFATIFCFTAASGIAWAEEQDLTFNGSTLTWDTNAENKVFTNAAGESASFVTGDNVTFASDASVSLGEDISAGQINIASGADVVIELADNGLNFDTLSMLGGSLDAGDSLNIAAGETLAVGSNGSVLKSALVLEHDAALRVDFAGNGTATSLNNSVLSLPGGTQLQLSGCGNGDGKTYTLLTGVSDLLDAQGNAINLCEGNNAIANYFDISQPGTGFWADATLQLEDGCFQLVRHDHAVMEACTNNIPYHPYDFPDGIQYYEGLSHVGNSSTNAGGAIRTWYEFTMSNNGNVEFCGNSSSSQGGAIYGGYGSTITLSDNGNVKFCGNSSVSHGGAIYGEDGDITLSNNGSVEFSGNSSSSLGGGAIYGEYGVTLSNNGSLLFANNESQYEGGAIYASLVLVERNARVLFKENQSSHFGGAIYALDGFTMSNNGSVEFIGNSIDDYFFGGAIDGAVTMSNNGSVLFSGNTAGGGGAIAGSVTMIGNGDVTFRGNAATSTTSSYAYGGAIHGNGDISLSNNGSVSFNENRAESSSSYAYGGAIHHGSGDISLSNNESVSFNGNRAESSSSCGGAIYGSGDITLSDNGSVEFCGNSVESTSSYHAFGGAIFGGDDSTITMNNNVSVTFSGNMAFGADAWGGAICGGYNSTIALSNNKGAVTFSGNAASGEDSYLKGGAISGDDYSTITLSNNGSVTFSGNSVSGTELICGGAICGGGYSTITLNGNGSVEFSGNSVSGTEEIFGGAICGDYDSTITLNGNGSVEFSGNMASGTGAYVSGGAIRSYGSLSIRNNDFVLFERNVEKEGSTYRLRSVYQYGGIGATLSLSAAAGKCIEFHDSVYVGSGATVNLNEDYTYKDADGKSVTVKQTGDIIFTGKYAETHLNEILAADEQGRTATTEEIRNSRTTEVYALTNLHGGRLRVEDGAIYEGYGITAHEGSAATVRVKDATLNHAAYELHFFEGTTLETLGESAILGDVIVESTATASFSALTRLEGSLTLASGSALNLEGEITLDGALMLGTSITLGGNMLDLLNQLQEGQSLTLISGLESFTIQTPNLLAEGEYTVNINEQELRAADYFSNLNPNLDLVLTYNAELGALSVIHVIPEPTTTTLSLLALTALLARRRRK